MLEPSTAHPNSWLVEATKKESGVADDVDASQHHLGIQKKNHKTNNTINTYTIIIIIIIIKKFNFY